MAERSLAISWTHFWSVGVRHRGRRTAGSPRSDRRGEGEDEGLDLGRRQLEAVIGDGRHADRHALDGVDPGHRVVVGAHPPTLGEVAGVAHAGRALAEDVGAEGEDHLRLGEVVAGVERPAEGAHGGGARLVRPGGLPAVPAGLRVRLEQLLDLAGEGRRGHRAGEDAQTAAGAERAHRLADLADEGAPGAGAAVVQDRLRPLGVVEGEHGGLGVGIGRAEARRMVRVPLDLGRPPLVALGEHAGRVAGVGQRGREVEGLAGDQLLGLADVGDDVLERLLGAAGEPGEGERGAGELEEAAARHAGRPLRREAGELAVDELLELGGLGELVEAAPELRPLPGLQPLADLCQVEPGRSRRGSGFGAAFSRGARGAFRALGAYGVHAVHQVRSLSLLIRQPFAAAADVQLGRLGLDAAPVAPVAGASGGTSSSSSKSAGRTASPASPATARCPRRSAPTPGRARAGPCT